MLFDSEYFHKHIAVLQEVKPLIQSQIINFCDNYLQGRDKKIITSVFDTFYDCIFYDCLEIHKIKMTLAKEIIDSNILKSLLNFFFLKLIIIYSKKSNDESIKELIRRIDFAKQSLDSFASMQNIYNVYSEQSKIKSTFFEHHVDTFRKIQELNGEIELLNLYNGVNVKHKAKVFSITEERVVLNVNLVQILAMKHEGSAYIIKNNFFLANLKADIVDMDLVSQNVTLENFKRTGAMNANFRKDLRVHPEKFTKVVLMSLSGNTIQGNIYDISRGGLGIVSKEDSKFKEREKLKARFCINLKDLKRFEISLDLLLVAKINYNGSYRYCLKNITQNENKILNEFVKIRVSETFKELKNLVKIYR